MTITFQQFCTTAHASHSSEQATRYPLTALAQAYLQDWYAVRPIDGGVAFEAKLRQLNLDGSLASLTLVDTFLDDIRPELPSDSLLVVRNASQRNLLNFIGFYAGMVYAYQATSPTYWLTYAQLTDHFPNLSQVMPDIFDYTMAVSHQDVLADTRPFFAINFNQTTFFPLVAIIERLYPKRQPTFQTPVSEAKNSHSTVPFFGYIAPSLTDSVSQLLQNSSKASAQPSDVTSVDNSQNLSSTQFDMPFDRENNRVTQDIFGHARLTHWINNPFIQLPVPSYGASHLYQPFVHPFIKSFDTHVQISPNDSLLKTPVTQVIEPDDVIPDPAIPENIPGAEPLAETSSQSSLTITPVTEVDTKPAQSSLAKPIAKPLVKAQKQALHQAMLARQETQRQKKVAEALANPTIHPSLLNQSHSMLRDDSDKDKSVPIHDSFSSLEADLANISLANTPKNANPMLEQSYQTTRKRLLAITHGNAVIDPSHHTMPQQTIDALTQQAEQNHTGAMLMLAIFQFRGEPALGMAQDKNTAIAWVQQAANQQDSRAEKLLSKLYLSGELAENGVPQDPLMAQQWLESAASHGHPDAIILQQQMAISQTLKSRQREDSVYLQRLMLGIVALVIFLIIVIFTIKI